MIVELNLADDTLGYVFENILKSEDIKKVKQSLTSKFEKFNKVNLYLEEDDVDEIQISAFFDQFFFDINHANKLGKIAILSNKKWVRTMSKLKNVLISTDIRVFKTKERVDALCWVMKR